MTQPLEQFKQQVIHNPNLIEQFKAVANSEKFVDLVVQVSSELGYSFTAEEVEAALIDQVSSHQSQELTNEQLEAIAGGLEFYPGTPSGKDTCELQCI